MIRLGTTTSIFSVFVTKIVFVVVIISVLSMLVALVYLARNFAEMSLPTFLTHQRPDDQREARRYVLLAAPERELWSLRHILERFEEINAANMIRTHEHWFERRERIPKHHESPELVLLNFWRVVDFAENNTYSRYYYLGSVCDTSKYEHFNFVCFAGRVTLTKKVSTFFQFLTNSVSI